MIARTNSEQTLSGLQNSIWTRRGRSGEGAVRGWCCMKGRERARRSLNASPKEKGKFEILDEATRSEGSLLGPRGVVVEEELPICPKA